MNRNFDVMLETIFTHRTIRKFKNTRIPEEIIDTISEAGIRASNTGNMQVYSMIITTEENLKYRLWEQHFKQNMVLQAPLVITFCADFNRFSKWCELRNASPAYTNFLSYSTAASDALIAAQNVALAAEDQGLGICYLGTTIYNADKIIDILNLPRLVVPITTLVIGYPDEQPDLTDRLPLQAVIHSETYKDYSKADINLLYSEKENLEQSKQWINENQMENLAQVFTNIRYKKADNEFFSKKLLDVLKKQGFLTEC